MTGQVARAVRAEGGSASADDLAAGRCERSGFLSMRAAGHADPYHAARDSAERLAARSGCPAHDVAVVLGSGWAPAARVLADVMSAAVVQVPMADLGGFAEPTVAGHRGTVWSLATEQLRLLVLLGRTHLYEGVPPATVVHGVRTAMAAGCRTIVLTNAAGAIGDGYRVGGAAIIRDHLNLTGASPLSGPQPPAPYPAPFVDLSDLYSARLRSIARAAGPSLAEGVYAGLPGPHYETPAEITMLRTLGADLVGMSTVLEAIAARHMGAEVLGISLVTNLAAGLAPHGLDHGGVVAAGTAAAVEMGGLLARILSRATNAG